MILSHAFWDDIAYVCATYEPMYMVSIIVDGEILPKMGVINKARWHERGI